MTGRTIQIATPEWALPYLEPSRYKGIKGGRGSGKSHFLAELMIELHVIDQQRASVCLREFQKSLKQSAKRLLEAKIQALNVGYYFEVQNDQIKSKDGNGLIIFEGMQNHTADSIKSLEGFDCAWFEESQNCSQRSLELLRPTIRKESETETSELWFSWNPRYATDPIDALLCGDNPPPDSLVTHVNYDKNPFFPSVLRAEMEYDRGRDIDKYNHVWLGAYETHGESRVFKNWTIEDFDTPADALHRLGADWGFSVDPSILVRCHIVGRKLYIDYEAYRIGCDIVDLPDLFMTVPEAERWSLTADSARPETISHLRKHGFPKIEAAVKGARSIEEGVAWLQSFDIIVHPRCVHTIDELTSYRYKTDPDTDKVLPVLEDKNNHVIDALRYACEGVRRARKVKPDDAPPQRRAGGWQAS